MEWRRTFTIEERIKCIQYAEESSNVKAAEKFNVDESTVRYWRSRKQEYTQNSNKNRKSLNTGRAPITINFEEKILEWILKSRKERKCVNTRSIVNMARKMCESLNLMPYPNQKMWCYRFMKRNNLKIRRITHLTKGVNTQLIEEILKNMNAVQILREKKKFKLECIINCDETPIQLEMNEGTTVELAGAKDVIVSTSGRSKMRISCLLTIGADGTKYPPFLVFKGAPGGKIEKKLLTHTLVQENKIWIALQGNSWVDVKTFSKWYTKIVKCFDKNLPKLFTYDVSEGHEGQDLIMKLNNIDVHKIAPGLTYLLQPLDIMVNSTFKKFVKHLYVERQLQDVYELNNDEDSTEMDVYRNNIIEIVEEAWRMIKKEHIINSFEKSGIVLPSDGSQNKKLYSKIKAIIDVEDIPKQNSLENQLKDVEDIPNENPEENQPSDESFIESDGEDDSN